MEEVVKLHCWCNEHDNFKRGWTEGSEPLPHVQGTRYIYPNAKIFPNLYIAFPPGLEYVYSNKIPPAQLREWKEKMSREVKELFDIDWPS